MTLPTCSYSTTIRVMLDDPKAVGRVATAVGDAGGEVTALDMVEPGRKDVVVDLTCNAIDADHAQALVKMIDSLPGVKVRSASDRTLLLHLGGKLAVAPKVPLKTRDDLSMAYTPGVARVCMAIANDPSVAHNLTIKRNTVAVVSDGSAVLGLGNIGPLAAMPVMEGKAILFKRFADVDAWPICLATQDTDEIVRTVQAIAPGFGAINLEDIAAPRCFEVEDRLKELLDIPVFHDDQHGTSVVVLAALTNALKVVNKSLKNVRIAIVGAGAAGVAIAKLLLAQGSGDIVVVDRKGIVSADRDDLDPSKMWLAKNTNSASLRGGLKEATQGADVLIGVSGPNIVAGEDLARMASDSIVFALANPDPEVDVATARRYAAVVATGRSDEPNQINNVLAFPGIFRGALDSGAKSITSEMELAASQAIASVITEDELTADYIIPSVFNPQVVPAVANAVKEAASTGK
ncbi:MAG: NAD-dependent malic enzyme [Actinobacteria bacterium]|nr:NAD-dependent malic enzyme [Actinomycetota bacterium]